VPIENVELEISVAGSAWMSAGIAPASSDLTEDLFPPTF